MKYKPSRDLPQFVRELESFSPTKLAEHILRKRNEVVTPEAITMWFKRHSQIFQALRKEVIEKELPKVVVEPQIFETGTFELLPSVSEWIKSMQRRKIGGFPLEGKGIKQRISALKQVCFGMLPEKKLDLVKIGKWAYKHPDRLDLKDAIEFIDLVEPLTYDITSLKSTLKDFLEFGRKIPVGKQIMVGKSRGFGKFARLYVEPEICRQLIAYQMKKDYEGGACSLFMWKTGTRIDATLEAKVENIVEYKIGDAVYRHVTVYDKARRTRYPEGKPWDKHIDNELWEHLVKINPKVARHTEERGYIFAKLNLQAYPEQYMSELNRESMKVYIPKLEPTIDMPNHFWRHMFAQHMLRATNWNYGVVASLGGWTVQALEESYGKPPEAIMRQWGVQYEGIITLKS